MLFQYVSSTFQYPKQLKVPAQHNFNSWKESKVDKKMKTFQDPKSTNDMKQRENKFSQLCKIMITI
jgi:hypothetical protein